MIQLVIKDTYLNTLLVTVLIWVALAHSLDDYQLNAHQTVGPFGPRMIARTALTPVPANWTRHLHLPAKNLLVYGLR